MIHAASARKSFSRGISPAVALLLPVIVMLGRPAFAQNTHFIDSVISALATAHEDTSKLNTLRNLLDALDDHDEEQNYNEELRVLSEALSRSTDPSIRRMADLGRAKYLTIRAKHEEKTDRLAEALGHYQESVEILRNGGDPATLERAVTRCGRLFFELGDHAKAMDHFKWSYRIAQGRGSITARADYLNRLASLYESQNDLDNVLDYNEQFLAEAERIQDSLLITLALVNVASVLQQQGDLARSMEFAQKAHALAATGKDKVYKKITGASLAVIGRIHAERGEYGEAEDAFMALLRTYDDMGRGMQGQGALISLARVDLAQGRPMNALEHAQKALGMGREIGNAQYISDAALALEEIYKHMGRTSDALEMADLRLQMRDSIDNTATIKALARYEYEKKFLADSLVQVNERAATGAAHAAAMHQERSRRNIFLFSGIAVLLVAGGLWNRLRFTRRARTEADRLRRRAEVSEKFKQQFLANMSHEIRTPMNAIMGMTGILKRNEHSPEQEKYLSAISQSSENLLVILNDILDLSKLEAGKIDLEKVPFDVRSLITNVQDIIRFKAEEKGLAVEVAVADEVPPILIGDPTRLNQILLNLAGNAVKFTEQGSVTVRASATDLQVGKCTLVLDVIDTGIGIPADRQDKIFEEFTQAYSDTTRKYGGTGLGLTISKRLVELLDGWITVQSEKGRGSTFTVTIPYVIADIESDRALPAQGQADGSVEGLRDLRILLAEDNEFNVMVAQDELADAIPGVRVDVAANGRIAVELAASNTYDVILMDVQMPEMNGYDATKAIRALTGDKSRVPILAMTANVMKDEIDRCMAAGMNGHVPKPFKREELMDALTTALAQRPSPSIT